LVRFSLITGARDRLAADLEILLQGKHERSHASTWSGVPARSTSEHTPRAVRRKTAGVT